MDKNEEFYKSIEELANRIIISTSAYQSKSSYKRLSNEVKAYYQKTKEIAKDILYKCQR